MSKTVVYKIKSILGGQTPSIYVGQEGQFLSSIAIDPEDRVNSTLSKPSGIIIPTRYEKFSSTNIDSAPNWFVTVPQNATLYAYLAGGRFVSYSSSLGSETSIGTPTSGNGWGAAYYNDYIYLRTGGDISRYGAISGSPSLSNTVWTSTFGKSSLSGSGSISLRGVTYPLGQFHEHYGKLYFLDFNGNTGTVNFIQTSPTGGTDTGSTAAALTLPVGFMPVCFESYGSDLAIVCITSSTYSSSSSIRMDNAVMFLWDTFSPKPYRKVSLSDPLATAIYTHNGVPYVWSGSINSGTRLSRYVGGNQFESVEHIEGSLPPSQGAVDAVGNRLIWAGTTSFPSTTASIFSRGYFNPALPSKALHNIGKITGTGTLPLITALKFLEQGTDRARPIIGWRTDTPSAFGIDKPSSTATFGSTLYFEMVNIGQPFEIVKIRFPLADAVAANMSIVPTVYVDDASSSTALDTINNTNFLNSERNASIKCNILGQHNFFIGLVFGGTALLPVAFPIEVTIEILSD